MKKIIKKLLNLFSMMIKKFNLPKFFFVFIFFTLLIKPVWLFDIQNLGSDGDDCLTGYMLQASHWIMI